MFHSKFIVLPSLLYYTGVLIVLSGGGTIDEFMHIYSSATMLCLLFLISTLANQGIRRAMKICNHFMHVFFSSLI